MTDSTAGLLYDAAEELGHEDDVQTYPGYSGRGMMGKETTGFVVPSWSVFVAIVALVCSSANDPEDRQTVADEMNHINSDNMGRGIIIY